MKEEEKNDGVGEPTQLSLGVAITLCAAGAVVMLLWLVGVVINVTG